MLINPSPTTVLALWLSGCAAGGAGSGGQGRDPLPATHPLPAHSCPAQVLQRCPTMVTLSWTHGHAVPDPWSCSSSAAGAKSRLSHSSNGPAAARPGLMPRAPDVLHTRAVPSSSGSSVAGAGAVPMPVGPKGHRPQPSSTVGWRGLCRKSAHRCRTGFVSLSPAPPALHMCQLLWRHCLVSAGGA